MARAEQRSLRRRVTLAGLVFGLTLTVALAAVTVVVMEDFEALLTHGLLKEEAAELLERLRTDPHASVPSTRRVHAYVVGPGRRDDVPARIRNLRPGLHEMQSVYGQHVAVFDDAATGTRLYYVIDLSRIEAREQSVATALVATIVVGAGLSAWLCWLFAGRVVAPVAELARRVDAAELPQAGDPPATARIADAFPPDELGALAAAFDRYQERLRQAAERERLFTADASHELRTPLAVIGGAAEVMADDPELPAAMHARIARMQRALMELRDLLDALMLLGRGSDTGAHDGPFAIVDAVRAVVVERESAWPHARLVVDARGNPRTDASRRIVEVVLANLLRLVAQHAGAGAITIAIEERALAIDHVADAGGVPPHAPRGASLGMLRRLCGRIGWSLRERTDDAATAWVYRIELPQASPV